MSIDQWEASIKSIDQLEDSSIDQLEDSFISIDQYDTKGQY